MVDWRDRYQIVSGRGRYYDRKEVVRFAAKMWRGVISHKELRLVLCDDTFMRSRKGMTPTAVCRDAGYEVIRRRGNKGAP